MLLISVDNGSDKLVPNDVFVIKINKADPGDIFQCLEGFEQTGALVRGQIDLGAVPSHDAFRARTNPREEHEHLLRRGVLRFVKNNECVAQGAPARPRCAPAA